MRKKKKLLRVSFRRLFTLKPLYILADDYFVSNIEKVDSVTLLRKDKIMTGICWSGKFQKAVDTWPCLNDLGASAAQVRETTANPHWKQTLQPNSSSSPRT